MDRTVLPDPALPLQRRVQGLHGRGENRGDGSVAATRHAAAARRLAGAGGRRLGLGGLRLEGDGVPVPAARLLHRLPGGLLHCDR